jgi:hypothetical protein
MNFASSGFACHGPCDIQIMSLSLPQQMHTKHDIHNLSYSDSFDIIWKLKHVYTTSYQNDSCTSICCIALKTAEKACLSIIG